MTSASDHLSEGADPEGDRRRKRPGAAKSFWRRIRKPLAESRVAKGVATSVLVQFLRLVRLTNPLAKGSVELKAEYSALEPAIITLWHGQHLMAPVFYRMKRPLVALLSRSADAELNAQVVERFGIETVRGSGGRADAAGMDKGGAKALIALKKALDAGKNVCMIADIPHGTPRDAGKGIILLAQFSGRPIVPLAIATSRRKVLEKSWDRTAVNLPFGRAGIVLGETITVPAKASAEELEEARIALNRALNEATAEVYRLVDGRP